MNKINFQQQDIALFQDNVANTFTQIQGYPLVGGQILLNISLTSGADNLIPHSLGYVPTIILSLVPSVDTRIWSPTTSSLSGSNASSSKINLRCSTSCVVSVMVK